MFHFTVMPGAQVGFGVGAFMAGITITIIIQIMPTIIMAGITDMETTTQVTTGTTIAAIGMVITMVTMMGIMPEVDIMMADTMAEDTTMVAIPEAVVIMGHAANRTVLPSRIKVITASDVLPKHTR